MDEIENKPLKSFFLSNKQVLIIFCSIIILIGVFFWWSENSNIREKYKNSEDFIGAKILLSQENKAKSLEVLKKIIQQNDEVYSPLSLFLIIDRDLEANKKDVIKYFDQVLSIKSLEKEDRNLLKLKKAIYISEDAEENDLLNLLNPILNSNSVWKYQSLKFIGDYYFDKKEYNKAKQYYSDILILDNINSDIKDINRKIKIINNLIKKFYKEIIISSPGPKPKSTGVGILS